MRIGPWWSCDFCGTIAWMEDEETSPASWAQFMHQEKNEWLVGCVACASLVRGLDPWLCLSCEGAIPSERKSFLYCSDLCRSLAETIRYRRTIESDGRIFRTDVSEALSIKEAWLFSGLVYGRRVTPAMREMVFAAKGRDCHVCGSPATDIDHIIGSGGDEVDNLQPLCGACHRAKSLGDMGVITPDDPRFAVYDMRRTAYLDRVRQIEPSRVCDDPLRWNALWRRLDSHRKRRANLIEERYVIGRSEGRRSSGMGVA